MLIYLCVFGASCLLVAASDKMKLKINKYLLLVIAVILPSILAGCRDYSIGTDVLVYGNIWFKRAVAANDLFWYVNWGAHSSLGIIYPLINYIVSRFTNNAHWFYFILSLITNVLVFKAAYNNKDIVKPIYVISAYYFLYYNQSLNILRQSLALSLAALSFSYIRKNDVVKFAITTVAAIMTHTSAVMLVIAYIIYRFMQSRYWRLYQPLIAALTFIVVIFFNSITNLFINIGIVSERYQIYTQTEYRGGGIVRLILFCIPYFLILWVLIDKNKINKNQESIIIRAGQCYCLISTFGTLLAFRMTYVTRILYYFDILLLFIIPYAFNRSKVQIKFHNKNYNMLISVLIAFVFWIVVFVIRNSGETIPYIFMKG